MVVSLLVQKYGGSSVADTARIRRVAERIAATRRQGKQVVVVVSAMGKTTRPRAVGPRGVPIPAPAMDMLLTSGERISIALLCMAIMDRGVPAISFTGSQAGILTDTTHGKAKILEVRSERLEQALGRGDVAVVAGFQGCPPSGLTTLGRGDPTPRRCARLRLDADVCEILHRRVGVYTADPRIVPDARRLEHLSYDEMLEMAATGGRVLALRSVEFARNYNVPVHVRSSFSYEPGTWVTDSQEATMEDPIISGVTHDVSEAKVTSSACPTAPGSPRSCSVPWPTRTSWST
jgi:aspartate kinase